MKRALAVVMSIAIVFAFTPVVDAAPCPPEVAQAKDMLAKKGGSASVQAPRSLAGARQEPGQAPRGQVEQAPRGKVEQAPRTLAGSKVTSPGDASKLVKEAEAACKAGDMKTAKEKADAAISALK